MSNFFWHSTYTISYGLWGKNSHVRLRGCEKIAFHGGRAGILAGKCPASPALAGSRGTIRMKFPFREAPGLWPGSFIKFWSGTFLSTTADDEKPESLSITRRAL